MTPSLQDLAISTNDLDGFPCGTLNYIFPLKAARGTSGQVELKTI
jgi:hypothetical protein